jgi:hypothetical protein
MTQIEPDSVMGRAIHPDADEKVLETFRADRLTYWKGHLIMAVVLGTAAGLFLMWQGNPYPVVGPLGAALAIGARAAYLASEALADTWTLTERRLLGPGGRIVPLSSLQTARPFLGAVQLVTRTGDKHLMKYLSNPADAASRILAAAGRR